MMRDPAQLRLWALTAILFVAYLCVAIPLPIVPVFVTGTLRLSNAWAGLGVGAAFLSTIVSRGHAGTFVDRRGAKAAILVGLSLYSGGALLTGLASPLSTSADGSFAVLVTGRLVIGVGESLVGVSVISWGIALVGPAKSGRVLAMVGAAIYGALAVGGPIGLALSERLGFVGAMTVAAVLPIMGLIAIGFFPGVAAHPDALRPSFASVMSRIWWHGLVVCLQGVGFAGIGAFFVLYFLHRDWSHAGLGFTAFGGGFVLVRIFFGHLPDRLGGLPVALCSLAVETIGQVLIFSAGNPWVAIAGAFLTGLGCSMVFPAMGREVVHIVAPHLRGTALGGFSAFQDLAYGLTGPLAGLLADRAGYGSVFLTGGCAAALGFSIALALFWRAAGKVPLSE